nr:basic helix-loop-helix transcription factor [Loropetalum chinense var. rubrum]
MSELEGISHGNLWESHTWAFSNSENSGGGDDQKQDKKPPDSSFNSSPTGMATKATPVGQKRGRRKGSGDCSTGAESEHEIHTWTERERRKKMRNMFSTLYTLLPQLPPKADKSTIVDEAVKYIKALQQTLQTLQRQRLEMLQNGSINIDHETYIITSQDPSTDQPREAFLGQDQGSSKNLSKPTNLLPLSFSPACFQTWFSPNVVMSVCGEDAQISVCSLRKPGLLATIFYILEKHKLDVVSAHISSDHHRSIFMIHAHASGASDQFPEALPVEEVFKLAVGEMNLCLSSCIN